MLIKDCMTRHPIMVSPDMPATEAQQIMTTNRVRHLPVVGDGKRLLGLVTSASFAIDANLLGSLNVWEISRRLSNLRVRNVMTKLEDVLTADSNTTVEYAANMLNENRSSCIVVLDDSVVSGILSEVDLLAAFQELLGLPKPGVRVTMRMPNRPGEFIKLISILADNNWGVMGIGTYPSRRVDADMYDAVVKLVNVTIDDAKEVLSNIPDQELLDIR